MQVLEIELENIPAQKFNVMLENKSCDLCIYQRGGYVFADMDVAGEPLFRGAICLTNQKINQYKSRKFDGILMFEDLQGEGGTPNYEEFGTRYILEYVNV